MDATTKQISVELTAEQIDLIYSGLVQQSIKYTELIKNNTLPATKEKARKRLAVLEELKQFFLD